MNQPLHEPRSRRWLAAVVLAAWLGNVTLPNAGAQVAITEVMSDAATNCASDYPDFFEITNYGTNSINLTDYRWYDKDLTPFHLMNLLPSTNIAPGESVILVRQGRSVTNAADFRAWWGETQLPTNLQIYFYPRPGFDGEGGDGVRLWDAQSNLVDEVFFEEAVLDQGIPFVADPNTGEFGVLSQLGVCGTFKAAQCGDIGSPGFAPCGPIAMFITQQPTNVAVYAGSPVTFRVKATGLPRPRGYQWYHDGTPIASASADPNEMPQVVSYAGCGLSWKTPPQPNDLVIADVQPTHAGQYYVVFTNGLEQLTSAVITLTVNTNPTAPQIECPSGGGWFPPLGGEPQTNLSVSLWQTAIFDVQVRAYPPPTFRWSWSADGATFADLPGATNQSLVITYVLPGHAGIYRVRMQNKYGTNYAHAFLTVKPKPPMRITEAMAYACHGTSWDWWELTNTGDEPVNVTGYRWNDEPGNVGGGSTITNAVVIQPGESVILLESRTRESFLQWWGEENLPPNLQCIVYRANGLTETRGDEITLWNQSANDDGDFIDSVLFSAPTQGASFWFDLDFCLSSEFGIVSREEDCGTFRAANGCDLGSPGWTRWTRPCFTEIQRQGSVVNLSWKAQPGSLNRIQFAPELATPPSASAWTDLGTFVNAGATGTATDSNSVTDPQRFYRIVRISPADCNCAE